MHMVLDGAWVSPSKDARLGIGILRLRRLVAYLDKHPIWNVYERTLWKPMRCCALRHLESRNI